MGGNMSQSDRKPHRDPSTYHGDANVIPALHSIEHILKQWTEIINAHKGGSRMTPAENTFVIHKIQETEKEWRSLIESNPYLNESIRGQGTYKPHGMNVTREQKQIDEKSQIIHLQQCNKQMQDTIKGLSNQLDQEKERRKQQTESNRLLEDAQVKHRQQLEKIQQENKELLMRISKLASDKLLKSNPNIAELSDPNRPTKLGEVCSELYDNEYTDAFGSVCNNGYSEREAIDMLRETLLNTFDFCSEKATGLLTTTEDAIRHLFHGTGRTQSQDKSADVRQPAKPSSNTMGPQGGKIARFIHEQTDVHVDDMKFALKWKPKDKIKPEENLKNIKKPATDDRVMKLKFEDQMKKLRKEIAVAIVPTIKEAYLRTRWDADCIDQLRPFIEKCIFLSWLMNVQSPPMAFLPVPAPDAREQFNGARYKSYTKQGALIDYVVWPAMMLTKDGPIIMKGVAQGM